MVLCKFVVQLGYKLSYCTPQTTNMSPENPWLEDVFSYWNSPLIKGTFVHFRGPGVSIPKFVDETPEASTRSLTVTDFGGWTLGRFTVYLTRGCGCGDEDRKVPWENSGILIGFLLELLRRGVRVQGEGVPCPYSLMFPKAPQSSQTESLGFPSFTPPPLSKVYGFRMC